MKTLAFSLIELLVVVAIISILAVVAIPQYTAYTNKAKIGDAVTILQSLNEGIMQTYDSGASISSVTIDGNVLSDNSSFNLNTGPIGRVQYFAPGGYISYTNEWMLCVTVNNLSFPGYAFNSTESRLCSKVIFNTQNGQTSYKILCGVWDPASVLEIPQSYLPQGCNCPSISSNSC